MASNRNLLLILLAGGGALVVGGLLLSRKSSTVTPSPSPSGGNQPPSGGNLPPSPTTPPNNTPPPVPPNQLPPPPNPFVPPVGTTQGPSGTTVTNTGGQGVITKPARGINTSGSLYQTQPEVVQGSSVGFSISLSTPTGEMQKIVWHWGDATPDLIVTNFQVANPNDFLAPNHIYAASGVMKGSLTLQSDLGIDNIPFTVVVDPSPLLTMHVSIRVGLGSVGTGYEDTAGNFGVGTIIEFQAEVGGGVPPFRVDWDYGDLGKSSGIADIVTHSYSKSGSYTVKASVTDSNGLVVTASTQVGIVIPPLQEGDINVIPDPIDNKGFFLSDGVTPNQFISFVGNIHNNRDDLLIKVQLQVQVFDNTGRELFTGTTGINSIPPSTSLHFDTAIGSFPNNGTCKAIVTILTPMALAGTEEFLFQQGNPI